MARAVALSLLAPPIGREQASFLHHLCESDLMSKIVTLRRDLHRMPEVGLLLPRTQERVLEELDGLDLEVTTGTNASSIVAVLRGEAPGLAQSRPSVLVRGDMDALPIEERTGLDFASTNGAMHACGHDLHTAMLVGAAESLASRRSELAGDVIFMFQPGEEGVNGARVMIEEGVLDASGSRPISSLALHVRSDELGHGVFGYREGAVTGEGTVVRVVFEGRGGHGSSPHSTVDPVPALLASIPAIQVAFSREIDAFSPVVFTPGVVQAGTARNVVPDQALFEATMRTFDPDTKRAASAIIRRVAEGVASAHRVTVTVDIRDGYPSVNNLPDDTQFAANVLDRLQEPSSIMPRPEAMTEDFSRIAQQAPGFFAFLGACPPGVDPRTAPSNHSSLAVFDDAVMASGIRFETEWAIARLTAAAAVATTETGEHR